MLTSPAVTMPPSQAITSSPGRATTEPISVIRPPSTAISPGQRAPRRTLRGVTSGLAPPPLAVAERFDGAATTQATGVEAFESVSISSLRTAPADRIQ